MKRRIDSSAAMESLELRRLMSAATLRVVSYNIEADVNGDTAPNPGLTTVLQAIGAQSIGGVARPIDVLGLTETTSNAATVAPIVSALNGIYGAGTYAMSSYQGTEVDGDPTTGNGPSALVYNTKTLMLLSSVGVGTPEGYTNGEYRQVIRYEFQAVGGSSASDFYLYLSHYKSGVTAIDQQDRAGEAAIIRADEETLPSTARVIYAGDFNYSDVTSAQFTTLTAAGQGQAIDPTNPTDTPRTEPLDLLSESDTYLEYRDDYQMITSNVLNGTVGGLVYSPGTFDVFGNNGTTPMYGSVDASTDTALADLPNQAAVLAALTTASDHLPVVADYSDPLTATASVSGTVKAGASGLKGETVYLDGNNNSMPDDGELTTTTTATGEYSFTNVPPGQYIVRQELPAGYAQVTPTNDYGDHITVAPNGTLTNENFTDVYGGSVSGFVQAGSTRLADVTVYLDANNNSKLDSGELQTTTNSDGVYQFSNVPPGAYIVRQVLPSGYVQLSPGRNYGDHITLAAGRSLGNRNFIDAVAASISGVVFNDSNGDGVQDGSEAGLGGLKVYLDLNNTGSFESADPIVTTDAKGHYTFKDLTDNEYIVRVERPAADKQTTPTMNYGQHVFVFPSTQLTNVNFGEELIS